ncbi:MAG TPA: GldG family protein [Candidatus Binataceae bacterium]|nr:GldG family protein [Candidatus Binataceae bacterium]
MKRSSALSGLIGLVLLSFGILGYVLTSGGFARLFIFVNVLGGLFAVTGWLMSSWGSIGTLAGSRATRYGANAAIYSVGFIGLLIAINYLAATYHRQFDMTSEKAFSLSPQTISLIKGLTKPVKLYGFVQGGRSPAAENLYEEYAYEQPLLTYELVDPNRHPELAERFKVSVINTTHIQYGGDRGQGTNITDLSEEALTNGILKLVKTGTKTVYFTNGHGEADPDDAQGVGGFGEFKKALEGENYEVKKILLASEPTVPQDCQVLIIAGPTRPLLPHEIDAINDYLKHGGRALVMLRPPRPDEASDETALVKLVADWGVEAGNNVVVDQVVRLFAGPALGLNPLVNTYGPHPITASFSNQTVFPMVRSVIPIEPAKPGLVVTPLAKTSDSSWAETDLVGIFQKQTASFGKSDIKGPITVADAVQANLAQLKWGTGDARLVIFGDTSLANNQYLENFFNRDFLMNGVDWLAGEANAITIRPRTLRASRFSLTIGEFDVVFVLSVLLIPELLLIIGIAVWWERRS